MELGSTCTEVRYYTIYTTVRSIRILVGILDELSFSVDDQTIRIPCHNVLQPVCCCMCRPQKCTQHRDKPRSPHFAPGFVELIEGLPAPDLALHLRFNNVYSVYATDDGRRMRTANIPEPCRCW